MYIDVFDRSLNEPNLVTKWSVDVARKIARFKTDGFNIEVTMLNGIGRYRFKINGDIYYLSEGSFKFGNCYLTFKGRVMEVKKVVDNI